jgi:hypothetical protein
MSYKGFSNSIAFRQTKSVWTVPLKSRKLQFKVKTQEKLMRKVKDQEGTF